MRLHNVYAWEWVERPRGTMGRSELKEMVRRLQRIPYGTGSIRIEWDGVTHLDFRGVAPLADQMRSLREQGIRIRCTGFSPYLFAILRFALSIDEVEMFETFAEVGRFVSPSVHHWWAVASKGQRGPAFPFFRPSPN